MKVLVSLALSHEDAQAYAKVKAAYKPFYESLPDEAKHALNSYKSSEGFVLNDEMRRNKGRVTGQLSWMVKPLGAALGFSIPFQTSVWRGDASGLFHKSKPGAIITCHDAKSATFDASTALGFAGSGKDLYLCRIKVPKGCRIGVPLHIMEEEIVFAAGTRFKVEKIETREHKGRNFHIVDLTAQPMHIMAAVASSGPKIGQRLKRVRKGKTYVGEIISNDGDTVRVQYDQGLDPEQFKLGHFQRMVDDETIVFTKTAAKLLKKPVKPSDRPAVREARERRKGNALQVAQEMLDDALEIIETEPRDKAVRAARAFAIENKLSVVNVTNHPAYRQIKDAGGGRIEPFWGPGAKTLQPTGIRFTLPGMSRFITLTGTSPRYVVNVGDVTLRGRLTWEQIEHWVAQNTGRFNRRDKATQQSIQDGSLRQRLIERDATHGYAVAVYDDAMLWTRASKKLVTSMARVLKTLTSKNDASGRGKLELQAAQAYARLLKRTEEHAQRVIKDALALSDIGDMEAPKSSDLLRWTNDRKRLAANVEKLDEWRGQVESGLRRYGLRMESIKTKKK